MDDNVWQKEQIKPLNMFELAARWTDAIKVIGAGNGAGVIAAGVALNAFNQRPDLVFWIKFGGLSFFVSVIAFAFAFALIHVSVFYYDEMLHATIRNDVEEISNSSNVTTSSMVGPNWTAYIAAVAFLVGCIAGIVVLFKF